MKWLGRGLLAVLVAGLLYVFVWGLRSGRDPRAVPSPLVCKKAPAFSGAGLSDATVTFNPAGGGYKLVNFWASWCETCKVEHPHLMSLGRTMSPGKLRLFGVLFQDDPPAARRVEEATGKFAPTYLDPQGQTALRYGVAGTPESFLINPRGVVVQKFAGAITFDTVVQAMQADAKGGLCPGGKP